MTIKTKKILLNEERNVSLVTMTQAVGGEFGAISKRPGILILPGGGYAMCSDREAEVVAYPYLAAGFHAFVLRYSVAEHRTWPNPLNDYEQAMEYLQEHAEEWGLAEDKVAVIGFSAGGHLAGCAATMAKRRPAAAILGYAALEQDIASACQPGTAIPSPTEHVDDKTPPCFLVAARDDTMVPTKNTVNFMSALNRYEVTYECHIYPYGGHGFSVGEEHIGGNGCPRISEWVKDSIGFLQDVMGKLTAKGMEKPVCAGKINGNHEEYLSVQCTVNHLRPYMDDLPELKTAIETLDAVTSQMFHDSKMVKMFLDTFRLWEMLPAIGKTAEEIDALDQVLAGIPNSR